MLAEIESLLKQSMGLDAASIGSPAIERALQERLRVCKLKDARAYWEHVRGSAIELQELIEAIVVPETWFFRDREAFAALAGMVLEEVPQAAEQVVRLLSLPCSTGEEPYSIAMTLLDAGCPANRFRVDALDISARALARARHAVYGKNSFRGNDLGYRELHFEAADHGWHLREAVRRQVHFKQGNMFAADFMPGAEIYDVIFCRNLLIYFDRPTQDRAIEVLTRLLSAKGVLFVGPSETALLTSHGFVSAKLPLAFAFRKRSAVAPAALPKPQPRPKPLAAQPRIEAPGSGLIRAAPLLAQRPHPSGAAAVQPEPDLTDAGRLADQGRLVEAAVCCEAYMRRHGPSAQGFHLMGLIRDAAGDRADAALFYRKALYLDPQHQQALIHLALLLEKRGEAAAAQLLRERLRRLQDKSVK